MKPLSTTGKTRKLLAASALLITGFGGGATLAVTGGADAATGSSSSSSAPSPDGHGDETPLTGTTAARVKAAALAKYPGATVERVETDSDGVYEAHLTTEAGDEVIVQVDRSFTVTGTETGGGHFGGDRDDAAPSSGVS